jgi:hypothetical protein
MHQYFRHAPTYSCYFEFPERSLREVMTASGQRVSLSLGATDDPGEHATGMMTEFPARHLA